MKRQFLFLFFAIALASCNSLVDGTQVTSPSVSTPGVAQSENQTPSSGTEPTWKKYTNEQVGFSIQYPASWQEEDLPDENQGQMHHIALKGPEGGVELIWGTGLGGACPEGYQPLSVAKGNWPACHSQREDGTDLWSLAAQPVGGIGFSGLAYTNDKTSKSREVVLQVVSTLNLPAELYSSDRLGLCFSYPRGYTQIPNTDAVEIIGPELPTPDLRGLFWLDISDSYDRTAEKIADQEMTYAAGLDVGRWTVTLGGEPAVVLDGMPGQDLQRRVYVVHNQMLYILGFMPARSENKAANDQMEALFASVTSSWGWMSSGAPCPAQSTPQMATSSPSGIGVGISDDLCPNVIIKVGQQITWTNQGKREHIVRDITVEGNIQFDSGPLQSSDTFAFTFLQPQSYKYECSTNSSLTGTITVEP